jgi:hypothetical protein
MEVIDGQIVFDNRSERRKWCNDRDINIPSQNVGLLRSNCDNTFLNKNKD